MAILIKRAGASVHPAVYASMNSYVVFALRIRDKQVTLFKGIPTVSTQHCIDIVVKDKAVEIYNGLDFGYTINWTSKLAPASVCSDVFAMTKPVDIMNSLINLLIRNNPDLYSTEDYEHVGYALILLKELLSRDNEFSLDDVWEKITSMRNDRIMEEFHNIDKSATHEENEDEKFCRVYIKKFKTKFTTKSVTSSIHLSAQRFGGNSTMMYFRAGDLHLNWKVSKDYNTVEKELHKIATLTDFTNYCRKSSSDDQVANFVCETMCVMERLFTKDIPSFKEYKKCLFTYTDELSKKCR